MSVTPVTTSLNGDCNLLTSGHSTSTPIGHHTYRHHYHTGEESDRPVVKSSELTSPPPLSMDKGDPSIRTFGPEPPAPPPASPSPDLSHHPRVPSPQETSCPVPYDDIPIDSPKESFVSSTPTPTPVPNDPSSHQRSHPHPLPSSAYTTSASATSPSRDPSACIPTSTRYPHPHHIQPSLLPLHVSSPSPSSTSFPPPPPFPLCLPDASASTSSPRVRDLPSTPSSYIFAKVGVSTVKPATSEPLDPKNITPKDPITPSPPPSPLKGSSAPVDVDTRSERKKKIEMTIDDSCRYFSPSFSVKEEDERLYELSTPSHSLLSSRSPGSGGDDHGVSFLPATSKLDPDMLRALTMGTFALHLEEETGRSAIVFLLMDISCSILLWVRGSNSGFRATFSTSSSSNTRRGSRCPIPPLSPSFSSSMSSSGASAHHSSLMSSSPLLGGASSSSNNQHYPMIHPYHPHLSKDLPDRIHSLMCTRFDGGKESTTSGSIIPVSTAFSTGLEEGYLDLMFSKDCFLVESKIDLTSICKRSAIRSDDLDNRCCLRILFGSCLSDNRSVEFILSREVSFTWSHGLQEVVKELRVQRNLSDQRINWLRGKYLQLYYRDKQAGQGTTPTPAEAIKCFGGRKWPLAFTGIEQVASTSPQDEVKGISESRKGSDKKRTGKTPTHSRSRSSSSARPTRSSFSSSTSSTCSTSVSRLQSMRRGQQSTPQFLSRHESVDQDPRMSLPPPHPGVVTSGTSPSVGRKATLQSSISTSSREDHYISGSRSQRHPFGESSSIEVEDADQISENSLTNVSNVTPHSPDGSLSMSMIASREVDPSPTPVKLDPPRKSSANQRLFQDKFVRNKPLHFSLCEDENPLIVKGLKAPRHSFSFLSPFRGRSRSFLLSNTNNSPQSHSLTSSIKESGDQVSYLKSSGINVERGLKHILSPTPLRPVHPPSHSNTPPPSASSSSSGHKFKWFTGSQKNLVSLLSLTSKEPSDPTSAITTGGMISKHRSSTSMPSHPHKPSIAHSSQMTYCEFKQLYRCFMIRSRSDIKDLFDRLSALNTTSTCTSPALMTSPKRGGSVSGQASLQGVIIGPEAPSTISTASGHHNNNTIFCEVDHHLDAGPPGPSNQSGGGNEVRKASFSLSPASPTQRSPSPQEGNSHGSGDTTSTLLPSAAAIQHNTFFPTSLGLGSSRNKSPLTSPSGSIGRRESTSTAASVTSGSNIIGTTTGLSTEGGIASSSRPASDKAGRRASLAISVTRATGLVEPNESALDEASWSEIDQNSMGLLTRNYRIEEGTVEKAKIWDAVASASIVSNSAGVETSQHKVVDVDQFLFFLRFHQKEADQTEESARQLIQRHEPDEGLRKRGCLSFQGFACYLMDKDNYAFTPELNTFLDEEMNDPLAHYFIATSHNTYLTGHQLKGESSVELYSQILLSGCRCVELDCWDGEDGFPVIYHGHTLTSKIPFLKVIEAINESAFVTSPFPVILSLENHCSLPQQTKMAMIFVSVFGSKLVTKFMFDTDFGDTPILPSPSQLKYRVLIKNKKLRSSSFMARRRISPAPPPHLPLQPSHPPSSQGPPQQPHTSQHHASQPTMSTSDQRTTPEVIPTTSSGSHTVPSTPGVTSTPSGHKVHHRNNSLGSVTSSGSMNEEEEDSDDDDLEEDMMDEDKFAIILRGGDVMKGITPSAPCPPGMLHSHIQGAGSHHTQGTPQPHRKHLPPVRMDSTTSQDGRGEQGVPHVIPSTSGQVHGKNTTTSLESTPVHKAMPMSTVPVVELTPSKVTPFSLSTAANVGTKGPPPSVPPTSGSGVKDQRKSSSQVAPELSDLVTYFQAVKFRGLAVEQSVDADDLPASSSRIITMAMSPKRSNASITSAKKSTCSIGSLPGTGSLISTVSNSLNVLPSGDLMAHQLLPPIPAVSSLPSPIMTTPSFLGGLTTVTQFATSAANAAVTPSSTSSVCSSSQVTPHHPSAPMISMGQGQPFPNFNAVLFQGRDFGMNLTVTPPSAIGTGGISPRKFGMSEVDMHRMRGIKGDGDGDDKKEDSPVTGTGTAGGDGNDGGNGPKRDNGDDGHEVSRDKEMWVNPSASCYQVPSLNEHTAKKLCRKSPLAVITFTEKQVMRSYPAGMRIDSSNFNPITFWAFGLQMAAINYQTDDIGSAINTGFFEQNGLCGLIKKPSVMIDGVHVMFGRFNPWEKEFDGLYALDLTVTIISGQYVCPESNTGSPQVEVELIGIPVDCNKQRTKLVQRNSLNPIFNDTFVFRVTFADLAFIRFAVIDTSSNHVTSQRIIPINSLKPGYRHIRLRTPQNHSLSLSSLFIYSASIEEGIEVPTIGGTAPYCPTFGSIMATSTASSTMPPLVGSSASGSGAVTSSGSGTKKVLISQSTASDLMGSGASGSGTAGKRPFSSLKGGPLSHHEGNVPPSTRRRMFFLVVYGVVPEEPSTILKITQESTTTEVINQALIKGNKSSEKVYDYVLIEEVASTWNKKALSKNGGCTTQRILDAEERPLEAQANWKGEGRFVLKKVSDDPSTRAWMSTIKAATIRKERLARTDSEGRGSDEFSDWNDDRFDNFLVCVYNVSPDQPYTILKASTTSTTQEIIQRALVKARRIEDPRNYVIVEEIEQMLSEGISGNKLNRNSRKRILEEGEILYLAQSNWRSKGLFRLVPKVEANSVLEKDSRPKVLMRWTQTAKGSFRKISRMSSYASKSKESSTDRDSSPVKSDSLDSHPSSSALSQLAAASRARASFSLEEPNVKRASPSPKPSSKMNRGKSRIRDDKSKEMKRREVHSEGEGEGEGDDHKREGKGSHKQEEDKGDEEVEDEEKIHEKESGFSRLKKLSKKWKVWR